MAELPDAPWVTSGKENLPDAPWATSPPPQEKNRPETPGFLGGLLKGLTDFGAMSEAGRRSFLGSDMPQAQSSEEAFKALGGESLPKGGGRIGEAVGSAISNPINYLGPGGPLAKLFGGAASAVGGELAGQATAGTKAEPYARVAGSLIGGQVPMLPARALGAVTPRPISAERQASVNVLRGEGVEPTAGDITGNKALKRAEGSLGDAPLAGGRNTEAKERINEQFTRAALRRVGENANHATPDVIDRAFTRIGHEFDDLAATHTAQIDPQYVNEIAQAQREYNHLFVDPMRRPIVENVVDHAINQIIAGGGRMEGDTYQAVRSRIDRMRRSYQQRDPDVADFLMDVRESLDGVMERSIARNNPADLGRWQEARRQYRNMLPLERVVTGGGEAAASGIISPARLRQAVLATHGRRNYARGQGDYADLTRAGNEILTPVPTSQTAERSMLTHPSLSGAASGLVGGRTVMSDPFQAYMMNQDIAQYLHNLPGPGAQALRSLLIQMGQGQQ